MQPERTHLGRTQGTMWYYSFAFHPITGTTRSFEWSDSDCQHQCFTVHLNPPCSKHLGASLKNNLAFLLISTVSIESIRKVSKTPWTRMCSNNIMPCNNADKWVLSLLFWNLNGVAVLIYLSNLDQSFRAVLPLSAAAHLLLMRSTIALSIISLQVFKAITKVKNSSESAMVVPLLPIHPLCSWREYPCVSLPMWYRIIYSCPPTINSRLSPTQRIHQRVRWQYYPLCSCRWNITVPRYPCDTDFISVRHLIEKSWSLLH